MKRSLLTASAAALVTLAGCGSAATTAAAPPSAAVPAPSGAASTPAPPGATVAGVPALDGTPTDLTKQSSAEAGTGQPPTGLLTQDVVVGTGRAATAADTVNVRYSGTLYGGMPFDSSWTHGTDPVGFPLRGVVPGFAQGIEGMQVGGRREIVIPPALGYGADGAGPVPGNATLVFVVDLVGIS